MLPLYAARAGPDIPVPSSAYLPLTMLTMPTLLVKGAAVVTSVLEAVKMPVFEGHPTRLVVPRTSVLISILQTV